MEELRTRHAHRRLGFRSEDVAAWSAAAGLEVVEERDFAGDPLTVTIWKTRRPGAALRASADAASRVA